MRIKLLNVAVASLLVCVFTSPAAAWRTDVVVPSTSLSTHSASVSGLGDYFSLSVAPPQNISSPSIIRAYLEIWVDATAVSVDGYSNRAPMIELYPLKEAFSGTLNTSQFDTERAPIARNVAVGQNRRVVFDVTKMIKHWAANPSANFGVLIGGLTGARDGVYSIKSDTFGASSVAKLTIFH